MNKKHLFILVAALFAIIVVYSLFIKKDYDKKIVSIENHKYHPLNYVYVFDNTLSNSFCDEIIQAGEETATSIGGWTNQRHENYATTDIPVRILNNKDVVKKIDNLFRKKIKPKIEKYYKVNLGDMGALDHLDLFIVKYEHGDNLQDKLDFHRDGSIVSYVIQLSEQFEYSHGGTQFQESGYIHKGNKGSLALHSGKVRHGGNKILWGKRYIMVGFVDSDLNITGDTKYYNNVYHDLKKPYISKNDPNIRDKDIINTIASKNLDEIASTIKKHLVTLRNRDMHAYSHMWHYYKRKFNEYNIPFMPFNDEE